MISKRITALIINLLPKQIYTLVTEAKKKEVIPIYILNLNRANTWEKLNILRFFAK